MSALAAFLDQPNQGDGRGSGLRQPMAHLVPEFTIHYVDVVFKMGQTEMGSCQSS